MGIMQCEPVTGQAVEVQFTDRKEVGYLLGMDAETIRVVTVFGTVERPVADVVKVTAA